MIQRKCYVVEYQIYFLEDLKLSQEKGPQFFPQKKNSPKIPPKIKKLKTIRI